MFLALFAGLFGSILNMIEILNPSTRFKASMTLFAGCGTAVFVYATLCKLDGPIEFSYCVPGIYYLVWTYFFRGPDSVPDTEGPDWDYNDEL